MKRTQILFAALVLLSAAMPLFADEQVWNVGDVRAGYVLYCKDAKDANEIAAAYVKGGEEAATEVFKTKLGPLVVSGVCAARSAKFVVVKLDAVHKNEDRIMNVVEVEDAAGSGTFYVVNSTRVVKASLKVERNS